MFSKKRYICYLLYLILDFATIDISPWFDTFVPSNREIAERAMTGDTISHQQRKAMLTKLPRNSVVDNAARVENALASLAPLQPRCYFCQSERAIWSVALNHLDFRLIYPEDRFALVKLAHNGRFACMSTHSANICSVGRHGCLVFKLHNDTNFCVPILARY